MNIAKKIAAVLVMVLSALLLIVMLAGVAGTWWGQGQLKGVVTQLSAATDQALERSQLAVAQINTVVTNGQARVDEAVTNVAQAGATIEQTNLALAAAEKLLDTDLTPTVERVTERTADVQATIAMIDRTISMLQLLSGGEDSKLLTLADDVIEKVKTLQQSVADFSSNVQGAKSQATAQAVEKLTAPLNRVSTGLGAVSTDLAALDERIGSRQVQLATLTSQVLTGITLAAVALTLGFIWMALAQLALFVHAFGIFTGRDPLARWHKAKGSEEAEPVPQVTGGVA
jgi:hypothetical protein